MIIDLDEKLNKSFDVDEIEAMSFDDFQPKAISNNTKEKPIDLEKLKNIQISPYLTEKEIEDLKHIKQKLDYCEILIGNNEKETIERVKRILDILVDNNQDVALKVLDKKGFPLDLFRNEKYTNKVKLGDWHYGVEISQAIKAEDLLDLFTRDIKESNLTPFEKYISVYNIAKKFKQYKETSDKKMESRDIYTILFNDYMVCVGYAEMLNKLCEKVDIPCICIDCCMDISQENSKEFGTTRGRHERNLVYLKDDKYNIDGYYFADPCWDNDLENDSYTFLALTPREVANTSTRPLMMATEDLLDIDSIEEFLRKIDYLGIGKIKDLIQLIKNIDSEYYELINQKYNVEDWYFDYKNPELITDLYTHIQSKTKNKEIDGETIERAVRTVHKGIYPGLPKEKRIDDLVDMLVYNDIRTEQHQIEKTNEEGTQVIGISDKFKF